MMRRNPATQSNVLRLTAAIYAAALEPPRWSDFLEQFAEAINGRLTAIFVHDFRSADGTTIWTVRGDPEYLRRYNEHYHTKNIYVMHRPEVITVGRVLTSEELCPERHVMRSEYYADWLSPQDLFWTTGGAIFKEDSVSAILTSLRPHRAPPFGEDELALQQALFPHLRRALQLQQRLQGLEQTRDASSAALDGLPVGVILLDEGGHPLRVNLRAQELMDQRDGLWIGAAGVGAVLPEESARLRRAVTEARETAIGRGYSAGSALRVSRPSGRRPYAVIVAPLPLGRLDAGIRTAAVAVFVGDPEAAVESSPETLSRLYGLTAAESWVLAALLEGRTPAEAAEVLDVHLDTIRTHLKSIFAKTRTRRQSDLLRLVLRGPVVVRQRE